MITLMPWMPKVPDPGRDDWMPDPGWRIGSDVMGRLENRSVAVDAGGDDWMRCVWGGLKTARLPWVLEELYMESHASSWLGGVWVVREPPKPPRRMALHSLKTVPPWWLRFGCR